MPKRSSKSETDIQQPNLDNSDLEANSDEVKEEMHQMEEKPQKNPAAMELGRLGGLKGGKARAAKLTPEQRSEIAKKAASARWSKEKEKE